jgi:hypothetical protein
MIRRKGEITCADLNNEMRPLYDSAEFPLARRAAV